jgi:hypothetical protein
MATERAVLCGMVSEDRLPCADPNPLRLRKWGPHRNVRFFFEDMRRAMWGDPPATFLDLIDIAVYVYCADQAILRGEDTDRDFGADWRRRLFFRIPVRDPDLWSSPEILESLTATLSFLSEDEYHFQFERLQKGEPVQNYCTFIDDTLEGRVDEVMLFSGGLDSLGGAVQEVVLDRRRVVLVHHRSTTKLAPRHRRLLRLLGEHTDDPRPIHIPLRINKKRTLSREYTQRTRSFLYASLGAALAVVLDLPRIRFYENGIVSLNLPPSAQVVGARATRTTHPRVLDGFSALFTSLAGKRFTVENPFRWDTKADIVERIVQAGCGELIRWTTSCTRTQEMRKQQPHCGRCSQCIDRRFAILAAGQEDAEPAESYRVDLLTGARADGHPRTMLAVYVETASQITGMDAIRFFSHYGEASRVVRHAGEDAEATALRVFNLYKVHAQQVTDVVDRALARHGGAIRRRILPPSCLLRLMCDASGFTGVTDPIPAAPAETAQPPVGENVFRRQGQAWEVRFAGGDPWVLLPSKGAAYLHELLSHPGVSISAADLASRVARCPERFPLGDAGETADRAALSGYRVRLEEAREALEQARTDHDLAAQQRLEEEIFWLMEELRQHHGLGGRLRKAAGDSERIRKAVGNAVRRAVRLISQFDQPLGAHLSPPRLQCGSHLCYAPGCGVQWQT